MQALRILMLLVALAFGYLLFFRSQPQPPPESVSADLAQPTQTAQMDPVADGTRPHTQYKQALDRAHAVANQVQAQHQEADSY